MSRASLGGAPPLRLECKARLIRLMQAAVFSKSNIGRGLESGRLLRDVGFDGSPEWSAKAQRVGTGEMHWSLRDRWELVEDRDGMALSPEQSRCCKQM